MFTYKMLIGFVNFSSESVYLITVNFRCATWQIGNL